LDLLGIAQDEVEIEDCPSSFPVENRRVTHIPTVRLNHRSTEAEIGLWVTRIDQIIGRRLDRKGIIHTVSYDRARSIMERSACRDLMITHRSGGVAHAVSQFKRTRAPSILVSPSVTTGVDFPGDQCRYQIVAKIPFPDGRDPLVKARTEADPEYGLYLAMQAVIQASGRGCRSVDDFCETLIVDDMWTWFYSRNGHLAPGWFREAVRRQITIPVPLPLSP
jgi:Rad3-related DNA helicase